MCEPSCHDGLYPQIAIRIALVPLSAFMVQVSQLAPAMLRYAARLSIVCVCVFLFISFYVSV